MLAGVGAIFGVQTSIESRTADSDLDIGDMVCHRRVSCVAVDAIVCARGETERDGAYCRRASQHQHILLEAGTVVKILDSQIQIACKRGTIVASDTKAHIGRSRYASHGSPREDKIIIEDPFDGRVIDIRIASIVIRQASVDSCVSAVCQRDSSVGVDVRPVQLTTADGG